MATINVNTSITLPAGSTLTFTEGGSGQAIVAGNIYTIGLSDVFLGPFAAAQIITVLLFNGPISYYTQPQPVANANRVPVVVDPLSREPVPSLATGLPGGTLGATYTAVDADDGRVLLTPVTCTVTVNTGLVAGFSQIYVGAGVVSFDGTATVTDKRTTGATDPCCGLLCIGVDTYEVRGSKA